MKTRKIDGFITHGCMLLMTLCWLSGSAHIEVKADEVHAVLSPLDDTNWKPLADSLGVNIIWYEAPRDSSVLDSMYYECISEARRDGLKVGFWTLFDSKRNVSEQYRQLRTFAISDSTDMIPLLVLPESYHVDSLQRCLDSCRSYFGQSPALCMHHDQPLPEQFDRYHAVRTAEEGCYPRIRMAEKSMDDIRRHYPRHRYFEDSISVPDMIDVSHWQGEIDWKKVYESGIRYAYIKISQGKDLADDRCRENIRKARAAGIRVGVYHFFSTNCSAQEQFRWFCKHYREEEMDLRPMLDVERNKGLSKEELQQQVGAFMDACEAKFGYRPVLYSYQIFYNRWLASAFWQETLMLALYREDRAPITDGKGHAAIWQYSDHGRINGIKGRVDMNKFHRDLDINSLLLHP